MTHHFPWEIPEPLITEAEIKKITDEAGITFSDECIRGIYYFICHYQLMVNVDTLRNASIPEIQQELKSFLDILEAARKAYDGMNPFISRIDIEWEKATDRLIAKIKNTEVLIQAGRKKQYARRFLVRGLIKTFEDKTEQNFVVRYSYYRDIDRSEYNKSAMSFLKKIMDIVCPKLSADSLRKDIAWAMKNPCIPENR